MEKYISVKEILEVTNGRLVYGDLNEICENFAKDTKSIKKDDVFVGFKGENKDGGIYYKQAFEAGAKGCIINENIIEEFEQYEGKFIIVVADTIKAIQKIASLKRDKYNIPVIAITGSVGKTSTKDIIASVVSKKYKVLKTQGNMNNHIGLPMTILGLKDHSAMVVEMGMNHLGEIKTLTKIAKPTIAVITNVGTAHIGNLGSRENILKAKLEIIEGLTKEGKLIINNDNDMLHNWLEKYNKLCDVITYGIINESNQMAEDISYSENESVYMLKNGQKETQVKVPIGGEAFVYNSLAAICVGMELGISIEEIKNGILDFELTKMRLDICKSKRGYTIIDDCYNANYDSMKAALEYLRNTRASRKIAVLGDMLELGEYSKELHNKVGNEVANSKVDILISVGNEAEEIARAAAKKGIETYCFNNNKSAIEKLKDILRKDDVVLVKASNSMKFKEIVEEIR